MTFNAITLDTTGQVLEWGAASLRSAGAGETAHSDVDESSQSVIDTHGPLHTKVATSAFTEMTQGEKDAVDAVNPRVRVISDTDYTVLPSDNDCRLYFTAATAVTVTIDTGLGKNFSALWRQVGAGLVTFVEGTATIENVDDQFKSAGVKAYGSLVMSNVVDTIDLFGVTA